MILPYITNKEKEIIKTVLQFRFQDRSHLQQILNHKDKKTIQFWLNNLVRNKYLIRDEEKLGKKDYPVYYMGASGIRFLKTLGTVDFNLLRNLYREKKHSPAFVSHCLFLADICLTFKKLSSEPIAFSCYTFSDYSSPLSPFSFLTDLKPAIIVEREEKENTSYLLFEIIPATFPFYRMKKRIRDYLQFLQNGDWEIQTRTPLPEVFFVLPTRDLKYRLKHYAKTLLERTWNDDLSINLSTEDNIKREGVNAEIWEKIEYV